MGDGLRAAALPRLPQGAGRVSDLPRQCPSLSPDEAAALLDVHPNTLRRWTDAGRIPVSRTPGGHRRYRLCDVLRLVDAMRHMPP